MAALLTFCQLELTFWFCHLDLIFDVVYPVTVSRLNKMFAFTVPAASVTVNSHGFFSVLLKGYRRPSCDSSQCRRVFSSISSIELPSITSPQIAHHFQ